MNIGELLVSERALSIPLVQSFIQDQKKQYKSLTPEFSELLTHLETYLVTGGKWHRPTLGLLAYQIAGGTDNDAARKALISLEILHRYILIHDDIMDQDYVRHGSETIEKIYQSRFSRLYPEKKDVMYSKGSAIVAGDVVNSMALESLTSSGFEPRVIVAAIRGFNQLMMETAAGWQVQTEQNFQAIGEVTEEAFFAGMQLVSAQYSLVWPLRIGQILAGRLAPKDWDPILDTYGSEAGAAFQLIDDYLGMFGDEAHTGKPVGHDYREGKKTLLILEAYKQASRADRKFLDQTLGTEVTLDQLKRVQVIMISTGAVDYVKAKALEHANKAKAILAKLKSKNPEVTGSLSELADLLVNRSF